jgi:hypothetical protein
MSEVCMEKVREDVHKAEEAFAPLIAEKLQTYEHAKIRCDGLGIPIIAFCGHGRAGKDLAAAWMGQNYNIRYMGSISLSIAPLVAAAQGVSVDECFAKRHDDRAYWFEFCNYLRREDPTLLVKLTLADNDVVAGIRSDTEVEAVMSEGVVDLTVWVANDRVAIDPTVAYGSSDCDICITNHGSKTAYFQKLRSLARTIRLPNRETICPKTVR